MAWVVVGLGWFLVEGEEEQGLVEGVEVVVGRMGQGHSQGRIHTMEHHTGAHILHWSDILACKMMGRWEVEGQSLLLWWVAGRVLCRRY